MTARRYNASTGQRLYVSTGENAYCPGVCDPCTALLWQDNFDDPSNLILPRWVEKSCPGDDTVNFPFFEVNPATNNLIHDDPTGPGPTAADSSVYWDIPQHNPADYDCISVETEVSWTNSLTNITGFGIAGGPFVYSDALVTPTVYRAELTADACPTGTPVAGAVAGTKDKWQLRLSRVGGSTWHVTYCHGGIEIDTKSMEWYGDYILANPLRIVLRARQFNGGQSLYRYVKVYVNALIPRAPIPYPGSAIKPASGDLVGLLYAAQGDEQLGVGAE